MMMPTTGTTFLHDSSSTLGDYSFEGDGSGSRWDHEEVPAFPLPFSSRISPKLPQRQRTLENHEEDMIALMMMSSDAVDGISTKRGSQNQHDEISVTNPSFDEQDIDCPKQHLDMRIPTTTRNVRGDNHELSPLRRSSPHSRSNRRALAQMRFQCLVLKSNRLQHHHRQNSKRSMLVVEDNTDATSLIGTRGLTREERSSGSGNSRASTI